MKHLYYIITVAAILIIAAFFGGMKYGSISTTGTRSQRVGQFAGTGNFTGMPGGARGTNGGGITGQVIGKDTTSITVKTMDGSSKIVFLAPTTHTVKSVDTTANDVQMGMNVFVTGTANSDGSVTAQNIQIRQNSAAGMVTQNPASAEMPINPAAVGISPTLFPIATPITR